jgi:hypothetical protein
MTTQRSLVKFNLELEGNMARLQIEKEVIHIPCDFVGDVADSLNQIWLEWHSADLIEREGEASEVLVKDQYSDTEGTSSC